MIEQLKYPDHYRSMNQFAVDAASPASDFPQYVFIEPSYFGANQNDQHPPTDVMKGEELIANVYNELRANEGLWASTLLVILYDEHGGFYDHVPPGTSVAPDGNTKQFAFDRLGVRVPALLISPWVDPGVFDGVLDHTSLLKYATGKWGLGPLGARVAQAGSFGDALTRRSAARSDCPKNLKPSLAQAPDMTVELNAHQVALAAFTHHLEVSHTKANDSMIADHEAKQRMAADFATQSAVVSERVEQFLAKGAASITAAAR